MVGQRRPLLVALLALAVAGAALGRGHVAALPIKQGATPAIDLNGQWLFSEQRFSNALVDLTAPPGGGAGAISAQFDGSSAQCPAGDAPGMLTALFSGSVDDAGAVAGDQFNECSNNSQFNQDCALTDPFTVDLWTAQVSADGDTITGQAFDPGYDADNQNGHYSNCHVDSTYDGWDHFSLTRVLPQPASPASPANGAPGTPSRPSCAPSIASVTPIAPRQNQTITISGACFGSQAPYNGDSPYLEIIDATRSWHAGQTGDVITLNVTSWSDGQIVVSGFTGAYGSGGATLAGGDTIAIDVLNPQTNAGPATNVGRVTSGS